MRRHVTQGSRILLTFVLAIASSVYVAPLPAEAVLQTTLFDSVTLVENPNNFGIVNDLDLTINGNTAAQNFGGIETAVDEDATGVVIDYGFAEPKYQVSSLQLFNNGGSSLNDADGIDTAVVEVFDDSDSLLFSGVLDGGNGGAIFDLEFPTPLDNVSTVRLSNITNLPGPVGFIIWRQLWAIQNVAFPEMSTEINADGISDDVTISGTEGLEGTLTWTLHGPVPVGPGGTCVDAAWSSAPVFETGAVTVTGDGTIVTTPTNDPTGAGCYSYADVLSSVYYDSDVISEVGQPAETFFLDEPENPSLSIVKSGSPLGPESFQVGQLITYTFVATNTGNVDLSNVAINEEGFTGAGALSPMTCPGGNGNVTLLVGEQVVCTATYTLTQADVDQGSIANQARAVGESPTGTTVVSQLADVEVPGDPQPGLTMSKTANPAAVSAVGETITYMFLIANTGNVTITDVGPEEVEFSGTGTLSPVDCPPEAASLAPSQQVVCTATYQVTQADLDSGQLTNTATAIGLDEVGTVVASANSDASVDTPGIEETTSTTAPVAPSTTQAQTLPFTGVGTTALWMAIALLALGGVVLLSAFWRSREQ